MARERDRLELSIDKIKSDMKKSFQSHLDGNIDEDFFKSIHNDYQEKLSAIEYRLSCLTDTFNDKYDLALKAIELSQQAESLYLKANPDQKRRLLKSILSNCILNDSTLYPTYSKPFDIFVKGIESNNKLGDRDSNPDTTVQSRMSCHWTIPQSNLVKNPDCHVAPGFVLADNIYFSSVLSTI